ncbi:MAG: DUF4136 domain-containing protein [Bacteroidota bacterium]
MKTKISLIALGLGLLFTLACTKYPPSTDRLLEDLAVLTQYDTKADFGSYKYYVVATSIKKITDKDTTDITNADAQTILGEISNQMKQRGYLPAPSGTKADLGLSVMYFQNTYVYTYSYNYWGYYYPYYTYYPYYPTYYTSYTAGMLLIEMQDLKNYNPTTQKVYIRWDAFIRGLMTGTHTNSDLVASVDQAFIQTPQIQASGK